MGPLEGVKILEIAGIGPGPFAAMMLADMGADVIRVDRAQSVMGGDPAAPPADVLNRGRRSIGVDLKNPDGVEALLTLVESADALIEGFRPGVAERLGFGPDVCLARNPRLVFGRMTGLGPGAVPTRQAAGHDINYIALAGALEPIGRAGEKPTPPLNLVGDFGGGGMLLAFGVVCALLEAKTLGRGPGRRRRDGRRRGAPDDDVLRVHRHGHLGPGPGHQHARHRRPLLRRVRDERRQVRVDRVDRAAVLRRAAAPHRARRRRDDAQADGPRRVARPEGAVRRRCSRRRPATSGARSWSTPTCASRRCSSLAEAPAAPAQRRARDVRRARRRGAAGAGAPVQPHAGRDPAPAVVSPVSTPTRSSPTGASTPTTIAKLRETGAVESARRTTIAGSAQTPSLACRACRPSSASTPIPTTRPSPPAARWPRPRPTGHRVVLVIATRGEQGEPVPRRASADGEPLGARGGCRRLHRSAEILGVERVEFLGYVDSGMMGEPSNDNPACFWQADVDEAAERLAAILRDESTPTCSPIYDDHGNYGHPDHIQVHRVGQPGGRAGRTSSTSSRRR